MTVGADTILTELQVRAQIKDALDCYALGLDTEDIDRFLNAWHEDATWDVDHPPTLCRGHAEITDYARAQWQNFTVINHFTTNHTITIESEDNASGIGHAAAILIPTAGHYTTAAAVFHDRYERRDGLWRIAFRKVDLNHWAEHLQASVNLKFEENQQ